MKAREAALQALLDVLVRGRFLDDALERCLANVSDARERGLARELAYGVCRYWFRLDALGVQLLDRPLKARDKDVAAILALGLYQLEFSRVAPHAAVSETVALCGGIRKQWASGLVNAVLRRFQRERARCVQSAEQSPVARYAHPAWLLDDLRKAWPDHWQDMVSANNAQAAMTLRVNLARSSREQALQMLAAEGVPARATRHSSAGIVLEQPRDVSLLPGFEDGLLSVQDEAAQLSASLLQVESGSRFLDACSAPGGKLAHVLETTVQVNATALERDAARTRRTAATLDRLHLTARLCNTDACDVSSWWDGVPFERILLDAPCSATGVIRRHPDIKLHRRREDVTTLAATQTGLLEALWPVLARDGRLLYATCSVMPEENASVVTRFASAHGDVELVQPDVTWGVPATAGRQVLPGEAGMDGFYYALLVKR
jgi:16S rRNA (cytosine967-C5)-methyltransferase